MMGMPVPPGAMVNGGRMDAGHGGGGPGAATGERGPSFRYGRWRAGEEIKPIKTRRRARQETQQRRRSGRLSNPTGAHEVAAARAVPRTTQIPGVLLAGNSSSSGVLLSLIRNIQFESGTEIQLGVATGN